MKCQCDQIMISLWMPQDDGRQFWHCDHCGRLAVRWIATKEIDWTVPAMITALHLVRPNHEHDDLASCRRCDAIDKIIQAVRVKK